MMLQQTVITKTRNNLKPPKTTQKLAETNLNHPRSNWNNFKRVMLRIFY